MDDYSHIPAPPPPPGVSAVELAPAPAADAARPRGRRRVLAGLGALAVVALAVGALVAFRGGSDGEPQSLLARAAAATEAKKTARVDMTMTLPLGGVSTPLQVTSEVDFDRKLAHATMDLSSLAGAAASSGRSTPPLGKVEMVSSGLVVYMKMPGLDALTGGSGKWLKIDYAALLAQSGVDAGALLSQQSNDPSKMLDMLRNAGDVTDLGADTVRGDPTTHYRATIDPKSVYAKAGAIADQAKLDELVARFTGPMVVDAWIGTEGLVRKYTVTMPTTSGDVAYTYEIHDFGAPVTVSVPADADAIDVTSMLPHK